MQDIILVSVPYSNISAPPLGISVLNGVLRAHGYQSTCIDLSMEMYRQCQQLDLDFDQTQWTLVVPNDQFEKFHDDFFHSQAKNIISMAPEYLGISVFSYMAHMATWRLCQAIRSQDSKIKIVLGGPGVSTLTTRDFESRIKVTEFEKIMKFGELAMKRKMADHVIYGDGEGALLDLLQQRDQYRAVDYAIFDYKQEFPFANFDDFDFQDYKGNLGRGYTQIPVFTSKGCVRNCDFCDVNVVQQKFRFRQGKNVVKELLYLADRYGIRDFLFTDSLVNGSLKSMLEWVEELARYNDDHPESPITWSGSWICRPRGEMKEYMYPLLARSGCRSLTVGAESGSNLVLAAMDKKTNVESLLYEIEQLHKNNINFMTLLIVGHWSEKWDDFVATLRMLYSLLDYARSGSWIAVSIGITMNITKNTPMDQNIHVNNLEYLSHFVWWTLQNPSLTAKERYFRFLIIEKFCSIFNLPMIESFLQPVHEVLTKEYQTMTDFYHEKIKTHNINERQYAEYYYENFDQLLALVESNTQNTIEIDIELESQDCKGNPVFQIYHNHTLVLDKEFEPGTHRVPVTLDAGRHTDLVFRMPNKNTHDTMVDQDGNILKDKCLIFKKFCINNNDILQDPEFWHSSLSYTQDGESVVPKFGLWSSGAELKLSYSGSFKTWYSQNSRKNSKLAAVIQSEITKPIVNTDEYYREKIYQLVKTFAY